ncbi:MAG: hypothetical protein LLG37_09450 [Spirochaetia bacterium]|nr:hypothetical protein [Spirochaetia bacterium]
MEIVRALLIALLCATAAPVFGKNAGRDMYNQLPVEPAVICATGSWEAIVTRQEKDSFTMERARCIVSGRSGRIEIQRGSSAAPQVIIFNGNDLYILDDTTKTARLFDARSIESAGFLSKIFITIGLQRRDREFSREEKLGNRECFVFTYKLMRPSGPFQVWSQVTEWRGKKDNTLQRAVIKTDGVELKMGKMKSRIPESTEIYEAGTIKCGWFPDKNTGRLPPGYTVVDMKKDYDKRLKDIKNIEPEKEEQIIRVKPKVKATAGQVDKQQ